MSPPTATKPATFQSKNPAIKINLLDVKVSEFIKGFVCISSALQLLRIKRKIHSTQ